MDEVAPTALVEIVIAASTRTEIGAMEIGARERADREEVANRTRRINSNSQFYPLRRITEDRITTQMKAGEPTITVEEVVPAVDMRVTTAINPNIPAVSRPWCPLRPRA